MESSSVSSAPSVTGHRDKMEKSFTIALRTTRVLLWCHESLSSFVQLRHVYGLRSMFSHTCRTRCARLLRTIVPISSKHDVCSFSRRKLSFSSVACHSRQTEAQAPQPEVCRARTSSIICRSSGGRELQARTYGDGVAWSLEADIGAG